MLSGGGGRYVFIGLPGCAVEGAGVVRGGGDAFFGDLAVVGMPQLRDLDVRRLRVSEDGVREFVAAERAGLPRLNRLGIQFASSRVADDHDWDGTVVGSGTEWMSPRELQKAFSAGSSLRLMPEIERWPGDA